VKNTKFVSTGAVAADDNGVFHCAVVSENMTPEGHDIIAWAVAYESKTALARASFLAAAPDLLAVAQELAKWEADPDRYAGDLADLAHTARAAIAKARGKS